MRTAVIGIGNSLMADDGIGLLVLDIFKHAYRDREGVEFVPLASGGMDLLHILPGLDRAIIIDAGDFGGEVGDFRIFDPDEALTVKEVRGYSLHELDIMKVLELSKSMGESPEEVHVLAIQPGKICYNEPMSQILKDRLDDYIDAVSKLMDGFS